MPSRCRSRRRILRAVLAAAGAELGALSCSFVGPQPAANPVFLRRQISALRGRHPVKGFFAESRLGDRPRRAAKQELQPPRPSWIRKGKLLLRKSLPLIFLAGFFAFSVVRRRRAGKVHEVALSSLIDLLHQHSNDGHVRQAMIGASRCVLILSSGERLYTRWPPAVRPAVDELWSALRKAKVSVIAERTSSMPQLALSSLVVGVYLLMVFTMMRRMTGGDRKGWGDARKKVRQAQQAKGSSAQVTRFEDIAGVDAAKLEVKEVVDMLKSPERYSSLGASVPRGILLAGPPGSGKTLLARACAAEAGLPFLNVAATEFVEMFVGRGAARVRQLFERARKMAPCIVFIDEIDALRARGNEMMSRMGGGNQEAESTVNQLLTCMDGLVTRESGKPVVVIGATNRPEVLDEALLRPGRFDRIVQVGLPDVAGRLRILTVHLRLKRVPLASDVTDAVLVRIAERSEGLAGAALETLVNEAAIRAARRNSSTVSASDLEDAAVDFGKSREQSKSSGFPWKL